MKKIVFLDQGTLAGHTFQFDFPFEITNIDNCPHDKVAEAIAGHQIAITNKIPIDRATMEANPQLKLIAVAATGYNHIDIEAARALGITVCNVAGYSTTSVAEHTFMMMIALMHRLPLYQKRIARGEWQESPFFSIFAESIYDLEGKTLGIVGRGSIGKAVAKFAEAFNMRVLFSERKGAAEIRDGYHAFDQVLQEADIYSLHLPLTDETENMIDAAEIARMKKGVIIINVSRGGIVNEEALADGLLSGDVGGAGIDVTTTEPPRADNPLIANDLGNFILTPHTAWASEEALVRLVALLENNINQFVGGSPVNVVS